MLFCVNAKFDTLTPFDVEMMKLTFGMIVSGFSEPVTLGCPWNFFKIKLLLFPKLRITGGIKISYNGFSKIFQFLDRILMQYKESCSLEICSLESELTFMSICSFGIRSRNWDVFEKPLQITSNPCITSGCFWMCLGMWFQVYFFFSFLITYFSHSFIIVFFFSDIQK